MRLATAGVANPFSHAVVGIVSRDLLPPEARTNRIFVSDSVPENRNDLSGYGGFLTTAKVTSPLASLPTISSVREIDHLQTGYIVSMEPGSGFIRALYRPESRHNTIFTTERCNSNCLMCSQPPQDHDDVAALTERNLALIALLEQPPANLVITGGEPTLLGDKLFEIITALKEKVPTTCVHMLTNGRALAWPGYTAKLAALEHPNFSMGIPLNAGSNQPLRFWRHG